MDREILDLVGRVDARRDGGLFPARSYEHPTARSVSSRRVNRPRVGAPGSLVPEGCRLLLTGAR